MADISDIADELIEMVSVSGINEVTKRPPEAPYVGYCLTCGPEVSIDQSHRWCDVACREDWELEQKRLRRLRAVGSAV